MATIKDVARKAGVSVTTVSRAFNNYLDISSETRARILEVAHELEYVPNAVAQHLVTRKGKLLGVFMEDRANAGLTHPFFIEVLNGFRKVIGELGYDLLVFANVQEEKSAWNYVQRARQRGVDGILLCGILQDDPALPLLTQSGIPTVAIDLPLEGENIGWVTSDNAQAMISLVTWLKDCGYTRIAHVYGQLDTYTGRERYTAFYEAMRLKGFEIMPKWWRDGDFMLQGGYEAAEAIIKSSDEIPEIFCCASDMMAIGVMQYLHASQLRVPEDVSVLGFDDIQLASKLSPALTTIRQEKEDLGHEAALMLIDIIERKSTQHMRIVSTRLVERRTTRCRREGSFHDEKGIS